MAIQVVKSDPEIIILILSLWSSLNPWDTRHVTKYKTKQNATGHSGIIRVKDVSYIWEVETYFKCWAEYYFILYLDHELQKRKKEKEKEKIDVSRKKKKKR